MNRNDHYRKGEEHLEAAEHYPPDSPECHGEALIAAAHFQAAQVPVSAYGSSELTLAGGESGG